MIPFIDFDNDFLDTEALLFLSSASGTAVEDTATGNPLTFATDLARPLKSLLIPFTPQQSGTGDPSPQNIRSILPWNGLTVFGGGKNLFNKETALTGVWWKGAVLTGGQYNDYKASDKIPVLPNVRYMLTRQSTQQGAVCYFDKNKQYIDQIMWDRYTPSRVIPDGVYYVSFTVEAEYIDSAQFEVGQTATAYEPYKHITETDISFPSPVYGGEHEAVSGKLMDGWKVETLDDANAWTQGAYISYSNHDFGDRRKGSSWIGLCSVFPIREGVASGTAFARWGGADAGNFIISPNGSGLTLEDVKTLSGQGKIVLAYPLATPQEQTLTGHQITPLKGDNTIWSDADGSMTAVYFKKP